MVTVPAAPLSVTVAPAAAELNVPAIVKFGATVAAKLTVVGEFVAELGNRMAPDAGVDDCGVKLTLTIALCPAGMVTGKFWPATENPAGTVGALTVTSPALAVSVTGCAGLVDPGLTLLKLKLTGLTSNCATTAASEPVPETLIDIGCDEAVLTTAMLADAGPATCGIKVTVAETLCPSCTVTGNEMPETEKAVAGLTDAELTVTLPPLAVKVIV